MAHASTAPDTASLRWSAAFFAAGALITLLLYRRGVPAVDADAAPAVHM
ncbi:hypothetical protein ACIQVL_22040 [Streptomyces sp. NPDC090499]